MSPGRRSKKRSTPERRKKDGDFDSPTMKKNEDPSPVFGSREEPPRDFRDQYLFLLEFFVHQVSGERLGKLNQMFFVPTCVSFEFLSFTEKDDIQVTPVDPMFEPQAGVADDVEHFYAGRSVMFAIDQNTVTNKALDFIIKLSVRKKMPEGIKPDVLVGSSRLDLSKHFAALRKEVLQCWHKSVPPPKFYEGDVPLSYNNEEIGTVSLYVRMSAFGQTIVTEFESPPEKTVSAYIFKGDEFNDKSVIYKCRLIDPEMMDTCRDSKQDLSQGRKQCRVCVPENHPCSPCGHSAGATIRPGGPIGRDGEKSIFQPASFPLTVAQSKDETCADAQRQGGIIQTSRGPALPCGKAVVLKVSGLLDGSSEKKPTVTVASEAEAAGPDNPDPDHDVFVLRIGKKGLVGVGEKSDIQLEMRTPKGPERRPPLRHETREMQTEDERKAKKDKRGKKKNK